MLRCFGCWCVRLVVVVVAVVVMLLLFVVVVVLAVAVVVVSLLSSLLLLLLLWLLSLLLSLSSLAWPSGRFKSRQPYITRGYPEFIIEIASTYSLLRPYDPLSTGLLVSSPLASHQVQYLAYVTQRSLLNLANCIWRLPALSV